MVNALFGPGDSFGARYTIEAEIGRGGMGIVYRASDSELGRSVALKILLPSLTDDEFRRRFQREATTLARIKSRHIVAIHDVGSEGVLSYLITELMPDGDLQRWITERGPLDRREALAVAAQVCEGLADAHAVGVIHRDVKPGNVLLWNRAGALVPYLCDFGIALDGHAALTRTGTLVGSPAYMAPERHFGAPADQRGDLYSVGCLLWALLTGDAPYSGTDFQVANAHINSPVPQLDAAEPIDESINELLRDCLRKEPEERIQSADELQQRMLRLVDAYPGVGPGPAPARGDRDESVDPAVSSSPSVAEAVTQMKITASPEASMTEAADLAAQRPPSGRGPLIAVAVVALVVALCGLGIAVATSGATETAQPSSRSSDTIGKTPDSTTPVAPKGVARAGYMSVRVLMEPRAPGVVYEMKGDDGWKKVGRHIRLTTPVGGRRACATVRTSTADDPDSHSKPTHLCARSEPPRVRLVKTTRVCKHGKYNCRFWSVYAEGFKPGTTPATAIVTHDGRVWTHDSHPARRLRIGSDGRGRQIAEWAVQEGYYDQWVTLSIAGVTDRVFVR